jgi:murein hydrolase activator
VDCGGGYHFVLGGLDRLDVSPGQKVLAGEPVGLLGGGTPGIATTDGSGRATLYVELRRRGDPVDPRPWFAARG